ncbi:uncharacterized protein DUF3348 [Arenicella xantha]|uniref:Uncharacterized protein DUF3348 n=2 Tax=Arenicella xantha TaxID=644221 RepID=A0A395JJ37_9GAMM|nr:uncharacterized protein DUF3348 [Arenicella xantha]
MLAELTGSKVSAVERNLSLRLAGLIGLSDSITLARALKQLPDTSAAQNFANTSTIQEDVLASRERMLTMISRSFSPDIETMPVRVPSANAGVKADALLVYQPYQRFYITHQVEMAAGIQSLRERVRQALAAASPQMHKLAVLDRIVDDSITIQSRKLFSVTPKILERSFEQLLAEHLEQDALTEEASDSEVSEWLAPGGWLARFYDNMRELLFAEFDVRLQPVLGLLEALNEQVTDT